MRTLQCPLCGSRWKVIPEAQVPGTPDPVWMTCVPCEQKLPQQIHDADDIDGDELNPEGRDASE